MYVRVRWNSTYQMLSRLLEQRWLMTATLSDPAVTQRGKHYLDLKPEQWILIEGLSQVLEPFEAATVFLSGQLYVTLSALPKLVHKLKNNKQSPEHPLSKKENQLPWWKMNAARTGKAGKDLVVYSGHIHAIRASVFSSRKHCFKAQGKPQFRAC